MLEQRRAKQKGYITLREAAEISGYAPDYLGQLIRGGKIRGEQVYANVAWVTTEDEVLAYMSDKSRTADDASRYTFFGSIGGTVLAYILYAVIAILVGAVLFLQYVLYVSVDDFMHREPVVPQEQYQVEEFSSVTI